MQKGTALLGILLGALAVSFSQLDMRNLSRQLGESFHIYRQHLMFKLLLTGLLLLILAYTIYTLFFKPSQNKPEDVPPPQYCQRIEPQDFEWQREVYTEMKKDELYRSPEYKEALQRKGHSEESWNWQKREDLRKKMGLPPSPLSSDEELLSDSD